MKKTRVFRDENDTPCYADPQPVKETRCRAMVMASLVDGCLLRQCRNTHGLQQTDIVDTLDRFQHKRVWICRIHYRVAKVSEWRLALWNGPPTGYRVRVTTPYDEATLSEHVETSNVWDAIATTRSERLRKRLKEQLSTIVARESERLATASRQRLSLEDERKRLVNEHKETTEALEECFKGAELLSKRREDESKECKRTEEQLERQLSAMRSSVQELQNKLVIQQEEAALMKTQLKRYERQLADLRSREAEFKEKEEEFLDREQEYKRKDQQMRKREAEKDRQVYLLEDRIRELEQLLEASRQEAEKQRKWKDLYATKLQRTSSP